MISLFLSGHCRCSNGYFGQPTVKGGSCQPCQCNGNLDLASPRSCDPITGSCLRCRDGYGGTTCDTCAEGFYGDAIEAKNCQREYKKYMSIRACSTLKPLFLSVSFEERSVPVMLCERCLSACLPDRQPACQMWRCLWRCLALRIWECVQMVTVCVNPHKQPVLTYKLQCSPHKSL